nr:MFS transporter [Gardnerella vaginalis]
MITNENDNVVVNNNKISSKAMIAIVLVTSLFFVWGLTMNLVNALNSPFGNYLELNNTQKALL